MSALRRDRPAAPRLPDSFGTGAWDAATAAVGVDAPDAVKVAAAVLVEHGFDRQGGSPHSWRCDYPDRYGPCDCLFDLAHDLARALGGVA